MKCCIGNTEQPNEGPQLNACQRDAELDLVIGGPNGRRFVKRLCPEHHAELTGLMTKARRS